MRVSSPRNRCTKSGASWRFDAGSTNARRPTLAINCFGGRMSAIQCPACLGANIGQLLQRHTIGQVAEYFIPKARSRGRHDALLTVLRRLWNGAEVVDIRSCLDCGLGFAVPFVAGDMA